MKKKFAEICPALGIVVPPARQLSWAHHVLIEERQRELNEKHAETGVSQRIMTTIPSLAGRSSWIADRLKIKGVRIL
jgi:hypothetical protein